jgi:hypothetical protein
MGQILKALEDWWMASGFPEDKALVLERLKSIAPLPNAVASPHKDEPTAE